MLKFRIDIEMITPLGVRELSDAHKWAKVIKEML